MTSAKRAAYKARMTVRVVDRSFGLAEVWLPGGAIVQVWFVRGRVEIFGGDPITSIEKEILTEKVLAFFSNFSKQEQGILFG